MSHFPVIPALFGAVGLLAGAVAAPAEDGASRTDQPHLDDGGHARHSVMLLGGHSIYHEETREAGVAMGLSIEGSTLGASPLAAACRYLQSLSELDSETEDGLELDTLFIAPLKDFAVEGFYLPSDGHFGSHAFVNGKRLDRSMIEDVVDRAGIPPFLLYEADVEQEISCRLDEPIWFVTWQDIRMIDDQEPEVIIEQARARFMSIYRIVVQNVAYTN